MFYKKYSEVKNAYIFKDKIGDHDNASKLTEITEEEFLEKFDIGFDGCYYLKSFLESPDEDYLSRKKQWDNQNEILELKRYLSDTDYVISKLNELKLEDEEEYEAAKAEYSETLKKRKEARARINELEG